MYILYIVFIVCVLLVTVNQRQMIDTYPPPNWFGSGHAEAFMLRQKLGACIKLLHSLKVMVKEVEDGRDYN